jgi:hypothetical protein
MSGANATMIFGCVDAAVAVQGEDAVLDALAAACAPWMTADAPFNALHPDMWTICLDDKKDVPAGAQLIAARIGAPVYLSLSTRTLHIPPPDNASPYRPLIRLLRAIARRQLSALGEIFLQAAILRLAGGGIALLGRACTGKTTTLIAALQRHGGDLIANDDASIRIGPGQQTIGRGYPRAVELRRSTLIHLREQGRGILSIAELDAAQMDTAEDVMSVEPSVLAAALSAGLAPCAELSALVVLGRGDRSQIRRLGRTAAATAVAGCVTSADPYETWLEPYLPAGMTSREQAEFLADRIPTWHLTQPLTSLSRSADLLADLLLDIGGPR